MDEKKLDALTPKQRTAVQLKEKGLTIKQVAAAMGVTYNAAREHLMQHGNICDTQSVGSGNTKSTWQWRNAIWNRRTSN